jgi:hypothetical protein
MSDPKDPERNRITARIGRVAQVGANMSGAVAARVTGARASRDRSDVHTSELQSLREL